MWPQESLTAIRIRDYLDNADHAGYVGQNTTEAIWSAPLDPATANYLSFLKHAIVYSTVLLYVYDYVCTLDREVKFIWSRPRSAGTYLFALCRYLPFVDLSVAVSALHIHEPQACYRRYSAIAMLNTIGITLTQLILCLRTLAIWRRQRWVRICLPLAGLTTFTFTIIVLHFFIRSLEFVPSVDGRDCNLARASKIVIAPYLSVVCYETLIVVLTIIKAVEHIPASQLVKAADWTWVHQFYHRGVIFFILTLCVSIVNVVYPFVASPGMRSLFTDVQRAMHSMLCTRVVFVICSLQRRDEHDRARTEARKERKRNRNKIRKKSHCKFNSSSTSSAGNPGFVSPFSNHKRRDPCSDSDSDLVYNPEYDIDLDYGYNLDCNRDDEDYYHKNKRGEMAYEDGEDGNRHTNSNWRGWQESTTGVITSMLDTYVTNEDAYGPYAVYDEDRERHGGFESGSGGVEVGESGGQESSGSSGSALRRSQSRSRS